jgi:2-(1,2-epoxy-1,2-dihydrophenyl)acetyl-CoA isomerase
MSDTILFQQTGPIATLTFNRPHVFNAMNDELIRAFRDATVRLVESTSIRALVVKGAGKAFLAGGDVGVFYQRRDTLADEVVPLGDALHEGIMAIRNMPFPVIAQVHGACAGAGLSLALACDFTIAGASASFNSAYARIGLSPDGGSTFFLPRIVGMKKALELIMLTDNLSAQQAAELGMVNRVVADDALDADVQAIAARLSQGATQAFARAKRLVTDSFHTPIQNHLDREIALFAECARTADFREGVTAFVEKRAPQFKGR